MLTLTDVKTALRIDSEVDDAFLDRAMQTASSYMRGAIDDYDKKRAMSADTETDNFGNKADMCELAIVSELWEHRTAGTKESFTPIVRYLINQLQHDAEFVVEQDDTDGDT